MILNHISALKIDHHHAKLLASLLSKISKIKLLGATETNIVSFDISQLGVTNDNFINECAREGLLLFPWLEGTIRAIVHMGIRDDITVLAIDKQTALLQFIYS